MAGLLDYFLGREQAAPGMLNQQAPQTSQITQVQSPGGLAGFLGSDAAAALAIGLMSGGSNMDSLARGLAGYTAGKSAEKEKLAAGDAYVRQASAAAEQRKAMNDYLKSMSGKLSPEQQAYLASDPEAARDYAAKSLMPKEYKAPVVQEFYDEATGMPYKAQLDQTTGQWFRVGGTKAAKAVDGGGAGYGLQPVWGTDAEGKPALVQLGKDGTPIQPKMPEGFQISRDPVRVDTGTGTMLLDPQTRQQIGFVPKDVAGEAAASTTGKARGEAQMALPQAQQAASAVAQQVESLKNDPYLPSMLGPRNSRLPNVTADAARVQAKMDQIQGGAFLQARQLLKGGGAITDYEGAKAEAAFARMNAAQSVEDYKAALDEFNEAVQAGVAKLAAQAGGGGQVQAPAPVQAPAQATAAPGVETWTRDTNGNLVRAP